MQNPFYFVFHYLSKTWSLPSPPQPVGRAEKITISGKFSTIFDPILEGTRRKTTDQEPRTGVGFPPAAGAGFIFPALDLDHGPRFWTKEPTAQNDGPVSADLGPYVFNNDRGREGG